MYILSVLASPLRRSAIAVLALLLSGSVSWAEEGPEPKLAKAIEVLEAIQDIPEQAIPPSLLSNAHGIAVIPEVIKVGFIVGGRHGKGVVSIRQEDGSWSRPGFIELRGGSVGWQVGAQSSDVVLVFKNAQGVRDIAEGKVTLGTDAAIAAGPVGRQASAETDTDLKAEIYSYSRSRGLFAGISLAGSSIREDVDANDAFYVQPGIKLADIFSGKDLGTPGNAPEFMHLLSRIAPLAE